MSSRPLLVLALIAVAAALPLASRGATTSNLTLLGVAEDSFYNYDFASKTVSSSNVDARAAGELERLHGVRGEGSRSNRLG
jgi:hypothetical protein